MDMSYITFPILPQHIFFRDEKIVAGLSRYPTTRGQSLVLLEQPCIGLFSLDRQSFLKVMFSVKYLAHALRDFYSVERCALVTEGDRLISIVPLHGLDKSWKSVTSQEKEFQESFPGYVSSKDGPAMDSKRLAQLTATIRRQTGLQEPLNCHFKGDYTNNNLFARLVRGELPQSRVWEDGEHVAFLTPFANTPGFTVLVPREHLTSDIFGIDDIDYAAIMDASYTLAGHIMKALLLSRCGMIFEGFEIDYAHVKLIPIHNHEAHHQSRKSGSASKTAPYEEKYCGYITSLEGPLLEDQESLVLDASSLRKIVHHERIQPPQSWENPQKHASTTLSDS